MTEVNIDSLSSDMEAIVGKDNVSKSIYDRIIYGLDPMPWDLEENETPYVVVRPSSTQEISEIMKYANKNRIPVVPHGSGTLLHGGSRPRRKCIILDTTRIDFFNIYRDFGFFECGPGIRILDLTVKLQKFGFFLPCHPGSRRIASMGGLVANNTNGHLVDASIGTLTSGISTASNSSQVVVPVAS